MTSVRGDRHSGEPCSLCGGHIRVGKQMKQSRPYTGPYPGERAHRRCMSKDDREEKVAATREPDESEQRSKRARRHESAAASSSSPPRSEVPTPSSSLSS